MRLLCAMIVSQVFALWFANALSADPSDQQFGSAGEWLQVSAHPTIRESRSLLGACNRQSGRKTLFRWRQSEVEDENPAEESPIETDRPDFTEASNTVGRGTLQIESGYTLTRSRTAGRRLDTHTVPEMLVRTGIGADWFETRILWTYAIEKSVDPLTSVTSDGAQDLYLGAKIWLTEQASALPEMAVILQMTAPTGARAFSSGDATFGINWLYSWEINDFLSLGASSQVNTEFEESGHSYLQFAQSATVGYSLTDKLSAFTEWYCLIPHNGLDSSNKPQQYFDCGVTYLITNDIQLDIRAGFGLNDAADDFFAGPGLSVRF